MPSRCILDYTKAYFTNGTLPPEGTVCHPDVEAFSLEGPELTEDEEFFLDNLTSLSDALHDARRRGYLSVTR